MYPHSSLGICSEAFQLLLLDYASVAETYRTLFDRISATGGGDAFIAAIKERRQALSAGALIPRGKNKMKNPAEELVARVVQQLLSRGTEQAGSQFVGGVEQLMAEYLADIPNKQRRQLVQVSSMLQLIIQVTTTGSSFFPNITKNIPLNITTTTNFLESPATNM